MGMQNIRHIWRSTGLLLTAAICLAVTAVSPAAAAGKSKGGITISPAFQQVTLSQNTASATFNFSVINNTDETYEFKLSTVDFGSLDESGGVLFMGQSNKSLDYKYGLSQWATLGQDRIVVQPHAKVKVPITIDNKQSLAPGGHYGAVLVSPANVDGHPSKVEINQVMSSLLFVTKQGGAVYDLKLQDYSVSTHLFSTPARVKLRFQNAGNVHVVPEGVAYITDPKGRLVKQGFINPGSAIVLPETFRQLSIPMETTAVAWMPGIYHLHVAYRYQGQSSGQTRDVSFLYINGWYVIAFLALAVFCLSLIVSRKFRRGISRIVRGIGRRIRAVFRFIFRRRRSA